MPESTTPTTPQGLDWLDTVIGGLTQANVAIPLVFTTASAMVQLFRAARGEPPMTPDQLFEVANIIEAQVAKNDAYGKAEIARLTLLIEQRASTTPVTDKSAGNLFGVPNPGEALGSTPGVAGQPVP